MISHVLAPVDFSQRCAATVPYAVALADRFKAKLTFTYVIPGLPYQGTDQEAFYSLRGEVVSGRELDRYYRTRLNQFVQEAGGKADVDKILLKGDISQRLKEYSRENRVDLLVMGSVARTGISGLLIGNTAERVVGKIGCSLLAVKPDGFVSPIQLEENGAVHAD